MKFRTSIAPLNKRGLISHDDGIMMFGSCFSDNIGTKLQSSMFCVDINPFGTTFNPQSIDRSINTLLSQKKMNDDTLFHHNGVWNSFDFHSRYSGADKDKVLSLMNNKIEGAYNNLKNAKMLILTFGTAYVYQQIQSGETVNNCHKLPASNFIRRRLDVESIVESYVKTIKKLLCVNPALKIIFTVSPIRHISDGIAENSISKSTLLIAVDKIVKIFPEVCSYFPAYEIMIDDLRDYRFYSADMVHPSEVAVEYIWEIFKESYFTAPVTEIADKCAKVSKRFTHCHMTDNIELIEKFNKDTHNIISALLGQYPYLERTLKSNKCYDDKNFSNPV